MKNDASAKYWLFYTTLTGANNDFGESGAKLVKNKDGTDITGDVSASSSVTWTFDYDNETAGGDRTAGTNAQLELVWVLVNTLEQQPLLQNQKQMQYHWLLHWKETTRTSNRQNPPE